MNRADIRAQVMQHLADLGVQAGLPSWETLLVTDGRLRGYRFQFDSIQVYWFFCSRTLEFYDAQWRLLKLIGPDDALERPAA